MVSHPLLVLVCKCLDAPFVSTPSIPPSLPPFFVLCFPFFSHSNPSSLCFFLSLIQLLFLSLTLPLPSLPLVITACIFKESCPTLKLNIMHLLYLPKRWLESIRRNMQVFLFLLYPLSLSLSHSLFCLYLLQIF